MKIKISFKRSNYLICSALAAISLSSCVALVPYIEYEAPKEVAKSCPLRDAVASSSHRATEQSYHLRDNRSQAVGAKLNQLGNQDAAARTRAATELGELAISNSGYSDQIISSLGAASLRDESKWVRRAAVKALGKIGNQQALSFVSQATLDSNSYVSASARNILDR